MNNKYYINIVDVNGKEKQPLASTSIQLEHICKGGFRFITDEPFEVDDRIRVNLWMPDDRTEAVFGRICYSDAIDDDRTAYGFSILEGFYSLDGTDSNTAAA